MGVHKEEERLAHGVSRRGLLASAATMIALGAAAREAAHAQTVPAPHDLIDFHHHILPAGFRLPGKPGNAQTGLINTRASVEDHLRDMDAGGVRLAILSTGSNAPFTNPATLARDVRAANDDIAKMVSDHPDRFRMFATLPLPDVDDSLAEIAYGLDTLNAVGVHVFTSYGGTQFLGDRAFEPVFAELDRRGAVVKTHPAANPCCAFPGFDSDLLGTIELGNDNVRAIAKVLISGTASRYPRLRWVWSHAGGSLLGAVQRFVGAAGDEPRLREMMPSGPVYELKRFYYDIAQAYHPATLAALKELVGVSQIVFGTDYPVRTPAETWAGLAQSGLFADAELAAIGHGNARALLGTHA